MTTKDEALALALTPELVRQWGELKTESMGNGDSHEVVVITLTRLRHLFDAAITAIKQAQQAQEPVDIEYFGLEPWERDKPTSPTAGMNIAQRILHVGGRDNEAGYVEFGSIQAVEALVRQVLRDLPTPKQAEPASCRIELVVAIHTLASHYENRLHRLDPEDRKLAEGDIAHAMKIAAKWNWNGTSPTPPEAA
jgi:hypothetical protein